MRYITEAHPPIKHHQNPQGYVWYVEGDAPNSGKLVGFYRTKEEAQAVLDEG